MFSIQSYLRQKYVRYKIVLGQSEAANISWKYDIKLRPRSLEYMAENIVADNQNFFDGIQVILTTVIDFVLHGHLMYWIANDREKVAK